MDVQLHASPFAFATFSILLQDVFASNNSNTILDSSLNLGNLGGAVSFNVTSDSANNGGSTMKIVASTFSGNDNYLSNADGQSEGGAIFAWSNSSVMVVQSLFRYNNSYPEDGVVSVGALPIRLDRLCDSSTSLWHAPLSGLVWQENQCELYCPLGKEVLDFACVPVPSSRAALSVGECAGIGIGVGLDMLAVVTILVLWGRWLLTLSQSKFDVEKLGLNERLLSSEMEGMHLSSCGDHCA